MTHSCLRAAAALVPLAARAAGVAVDGALSPDEWKGASLVLEQGIGGEKVSSRSLAWIAYDDKALLVAFDNANAGILELAK